MRRVLTCLLTLLVLAAAVRAEQAPPISPLDEAGPFAGLGGQSAPDGGQAAGPWTGPAAFSLLPDYVTPVRSQGNCGSCWAFATYASVESYLLKTGQGEADLSENHLKNYHGFGLSPCEGGNVWFSIAYLSRLDGPVSEANDPYHDWDDRPSPGGPREYFLRSAVILDTPDEIKSAVMNCGALYAPMHWGSDFYRPADSTYYYTGSYPWNHAVAIVGWDDDRPIAGAPGPGAWLVRNSWGTGFGDGGYFWVSYHDSVAGKEAVSFQVEDPDVVRGVYDYDPLGNVRQVGCQYAVNVFRAGRSEDIASVGFYTQADGTGYDIRVYEAFEDGQPTGLLAEKTGATEFHGFHVVDLDAPVALTAGEEFVVFLRLTGGGKYIHAVEEQTWWTPDASANPGESYFSYDGVRWVDLNPYLPTINFCIKAYVIPEPIGAALLSACAVALLLRRRR